jgi:hypothetical protein
MYSLKNMHLLNFEIILKSSYPMGLLTCMLHCIISNESLNIRAKGSYLVNFNVFKGSRFILENGLGRTVMMILVDLEMLVVYGSSVPMYMAMVTVAGSIIPALVEFPFRKKHYLLPIVV